MPPAALPHTLLSSKSSSDTMDNRYILALFLILLVLGFGKCGPQGRWVCEVGGEP